MSGGGKLCTWQALHRLSYAQTPKESAPQLRLPPQLPGFFSARRHGPLGKISGKEGKFRFAFACWLCLALLLQPMVPQVGEMNVCRNRWIH